MLLYLLLFISFFQTGLLGIGNITGSQAILEHEILTLHHWLTPTQLTDLMVFCRTLPGGTALNAATLTGYTAAAARFGFWGSTVASLVSVAGLALPAAIWTTLMEKYKGVRTDKGLLKYILLLIRPAIPGMIIAAAILLVRLDSPSEPTTDSWSLGINIFLFAATLIGCGLYRFNATFMIILCGIAGCILL